MDKEQKAAVVDAIASDLEGAQAIFAVDYRGISVPQAAELRGKLAEADATFKIVKNRLAKRAAEQAGTEGLDDLFEGPTALTYIAGDPVIAAKAISNFSREHDVLAYKGGFMDGEVLDPDSFKAIARLPGLDVLHGQLVGLTATPLTGLVRGLGALVSGLAIALGQIQEQGLVGGDAEPEAPAEEEKPEAEEAAEPEAEAEPDAEAQEAGEEEEAPAEQAEAPAEAEPEANDAGEGEEARAEEAEPAAEAEAEPDSSE
jgi:large subunit ribosomal protein L10